MYWFIADTHFGSNKMLENYRDQFDSIDAMDEFMIEQWNKTVGVKDTVIIVGDFSDYDSYKTIQIAKRLNGSKHLIIGGNDRFIKSDEVKHSGCFLTIGDTLNIKDPDTKKWFYCSHYPMLSWENKDKGTIHVFGSLHSFDVMDPDRYRKSSEKTGEVYREKEIGRRHKDEMVIGIEEDVSPTWFQIKSAFDVFADRNEFKPVSAGELCKRQRKKDYQRLNLKYITMGGFEVVR